MLHLHSNSYTEIPSNSHYNNFAAAATSSMVGPTRVCNLDAIRHLFQRHDLTEQVVLSLAREALCHGVRCNRQDVSSSYAYEACHMVAYSNLVFVFSERFDALVSITAGAMQTPDSSSPPPPPWLPFIPISPTTASFEFFLRRLRCCSSSSSSSSCCCVPAVAAAAASASSCVWTRARALLLVLFELNNDESEPNDRFDFDDEDLA
mmetsp:Transcript_27666/g.45606  ORF Transcript_27666/g.45606 Transcript_27666/m.45606 type:complete len:206 (+) Transcript_27666:94-711(+)